MSMQIFFEHGTLVVPHLGDLMGLVRDPDDRQADGDLDLPGSLANILKFDPRTGRFRAPAYKYRPLVLELRRLGIDYKDEARGFETLPLQSPTDFTPYPHQAEALDAWVAAGRWGIVEMPTGSGKTLLGAMALVRCQRSGLVVVPTLELLFQWKSVLESHLGQPVGVIGGGQKDRQPVTVITYDSAALQIEFIGHRFGCLIFDEVHHLPSKAYRFIAEGSLSPFRLGLSATLARSDGQERRLDDVVGSVVYQAKIGALEGRYLAAYRVVTISIELNEAEQKAYDDARAEYLSFLRSERIVVSRRGGWVDFVARAHRTEEGRSAFRAYQRQRSLAVASSAKMEALWSIFVEHKHDRILVFTDDTETVYKVSERFFVPALTHHTPPKERRQLLEKFANGTLRILVAAKVLNEGVDVPDANIGIILGGTGSVREHVQRLGRILRPKEDKKAILYEVVSNVAAESGISERRRQHEAYGWSAGDEEVTSE